MNYPVLCCFFFYLKILIRLSITKYPQSVECKLSGRSHSLNSLGEAIKALSTLLVDFAIDPGEFFIMYNRTHHKTANWQ